MEEGRIPIQATPEPSEREHGSVSIVACATICMVYAENTSF
jgi:hypothetical protein